MQNWTAIKSALGKQELEYFGSIRLSQFLVLLGSSLPHHTQTWVRTKLVSMHVALLSASQSKDPSTRLGSLPNFFHTLSQHIVRKCHKISKQEL